MFRIRAEFTDQIEFNTSIERVREFFSDLRNFAELMPGIESITREVGGITRWMIRADVPVIGSIQQVFALEQTVDRPERIEWSPARIENKNYMRYVAAFEEQGRLTLVKISHYVELRRKTAAELHRLAALVGEGRISAAMQKRVGEMIRTFIQRARGVIEGN